MGICGFSLLPGERNRLAARHSVRVERLLVAALAAFLLALAILMLAEVRL